MHPTSSFDDLSKAGFSGIEEFNLPSIDNTNGVHVIKARPIEYLIAGKAKIALKGPDRLLFRLNKLLAPTKDLGSILTTFNYALYLLAYLDAKSSQLRHKAVSLVSRKIVKITQFTEQHRAEDSPFARLGSVVSNARATLRLFGLLPIYVRLRHLMKSGKSMDHALRAIGVVQCAFYAAFQLLENVAFLTDNGVLSRRLAVVGSNRLRATRLYKFAHRAWFLGVMCDFLRLIREAQLFSYRIHVEKGQLSDEDAHKAAQWYYDWIRPLAWLPIGWQLSAWSESGVPGFNMGLQGIAGVLADLKRTSTLWVATKDAGRLVE